MILFFDLCVTIVTIVMISGIWSPEAPNAQLGVYGAAVNLLGTGSIVWLLARQWATYPASLGVAS